MPALLPDKRGPRRPHKLNDEVVETLRSAKTEQPHLTTSDLIGLIRDRFGLTVHRRSIERALVRQKKRHDPTRCHRHARFGRSRRL